jgi:hypothetical protein
MDRKFWIRFFIALGLLWTIGCKRLRDGEYIISAANSSKDILKLYVAGKELSPTLSPGDVRRYKAIVPSPYDQYHNEYSTGPDYARQCFPVFAVNVRNNRASNNNVVCMNEGQIYSVVFRDYDFAYSLAQALAKSQEIMATVP